MRVRAAVSMHVSLLLLRCCSSELPRCEGGEVSPYVTFAEALHYVEKRPLSYIEKTPLTSH